MSTGSDRVIPLDKTFYPIASVERALSDFAEFLSADLLDRGPWIDLKITVLSKHREDGSTVIHEFLNYMLDVALKARFAS